MINRFSNVVCWLVVVLVFVVAGCEQRYREREEVPAYEPLTDPNLVMSDYASRAIEAAGGRQAWIKAERLDFDCVVTLYQPDGSFYLTEHHYEIYPSSNSIRISAQEPQGKFIWQLSTDGFGVLEGAERVGALPIAVCWHSFAKAILNITTAPVRLLDEPVEFTEISEPVKMEGLWYHPIERVNHNKTGIWSKVVFYQNRDSSLVDMIWFADIDDPAVLLRQNEAAGLAVRGYDYCEVEKGGVLVPAKIEIFKADAQRALKQRLVKIDFE